MPGPPYALLVALSKPNNRLFGDTEPARDLERVSGGLGAAVSRAEDWAAVTSQRARKLPVTLHVRTR